MCFGSVVIWFQWMQSGGDVDSAGDTAAANDQGNGSNASDNKKKKKKKQTIKSFDANV